MQNMLETHFTEGIESLFSSDESSSQRSIKRASVVIMIRRKSHHILSAHSVLGIELRTLFILYMMTYILCVYVYIVYYISVYTQDNGCGGVYHLILTTTLSYIKVNSIKAELGETFRSYSPLSIIHLLVQHLANSTITCLLSK